MLRRDQCQIVVVESELEEDTLEIEQSSYFYHFLEPISKELAFVARELEYSSFNSPRTMLTHARTFVENVLQKVIQAEKLSED